jgi:ribonuclease T1
MKKWTYLLTIIFVGLLIGISIYLGDGIGDNNLNFNDNTNNSTDNQTTRQNNVPHYVIDVLQEVQETGHTFDGYVGGRTFQNREKRLPRLEDSGRKIKYQEWDVHRKVKGKNRGAERLVTGSDENAYYTKDHYKSFIQIEEE